LPVNLLTVFSMWRDVTEQMSFSVLCKRLEVTLVRDAGGTFGMTLRGGASVDPGKCRPLTVTQMRPGGPADRSAQFTVVS